MAPMLLSMLIMAFMPPIPPMVAPYGLFDTVSITYDVLIYRTTRNFNTVHLNIMPTITRISQMNLLDGVPRIISYMAAMLSIARADVVPPIKPPPDIPPIPAPPAPPTTMPPIPPILAPPPIALNCADSTLGFTSPPDEGITLFMDAAAAKSFPPPDKNFYILKKS